MKWSTSTNQFIDLVVADPVVLVVVQNRDEHVEMRKQIAEPPDAPDGHGEIVAQSPVSVLLIERALLSAHLVTERLEEAPQESLAVAAWKNRQAYLERKLAVHQFWSLLAAPCERRPEHLRDGNAQKRRRHVGPNLLSAMFVGSTGARIEGRTSPGSAIRIGAVHQTRVLG